MKRDSFKLSFYLILFAVVLFDAGYLAFLGIQISQIKIGAAVLYPFFRPLTLAALAVNAALAGYTLLYLMVRKK
jgi:hypothetical protein